MYNIIYYLKFEVDEVSKKLSGLKSNYFLTKKKNSHIFPNEGGKFTFIGARGNKIILEVIKTEILNFPNKKRDKNFYDISDDILVTFKANKKLNKLDLVVFKKCGWNLFVV